MRRQALSAVLLLAAAIAAGAEGSTSTALNPAQVATLVSEIGERYRDEYLDSKLGAEAFSQLNLKAVFGEYNQLDGSTLATRLTADLRAVTQDIHSFVKYRPGDDARVGEVVIREEIFQPGIDRVERLTGNIGYIRITLFADPRSFSKQVDSAMQLLSGTRALIIDVRDAPGGSSQSVVYLSSHFFEPEQRVHLNSFVYRKGPTIDEWTRRVPKPYLGRDVFVLISSKTGSAAEGFAHQMQAFGRARIVGERSKGGAHTGRHISVGHGFTTFFPTGYALNPKTKSNWEKSGVQPDIPVDADAALEAAIQSL